MEAFGYVRASDTRGAVAQVAERRGATFIAGGTDLLNLMKDGIERHDRLVDINDLPLSGIRETRGALRIEALARMSDVAAHPAVRAGFPVLAQALMGASPQVRNMAAIGGNLLQRTRCDYFRDTASACNKRDPGSGCSALEGENRAHAILGGSSSCIAVNPSDMAVALLALDATVLTSGPDGERRIRFEDFHLVPGTTPQRETVLRHGELVVAVEVTRSALSRQSLYLKLRDRSTFGFAVVSVAAALDIRDGIVRDARLTFGGVATKPWRSPRAEAALRGRRLSEVTIAAAGRAAVQGAVPRQHNAFKVELLQRALSMVVKDLGGIQ